MNEALRETQKLLKLSGPATIPDPIPIARRFNRFLDLAITAVETATSIKGELDRAELQRQIKDLKTKIKQAQAKRNGLQNKYEIAEEASRRATARLEACQAGH